MLKTTCLTCGALIDYKTKYCDKCRVDANNIKRNKRESAKLYNDLRYKKARKVVLKRDSFCCQECLKNGYLEYRNLETHHIKPLDKFPDLAFEVDNLITVCKQCHAKLDAKLRK